MLALQRRRTNTVMLSDQLSMCKAHLLIGEGV